MANTVELYNKTGFHNKDKRIFENTNIVILILVISLLFIGYTVYVYFYSNSNNNIQANSSYYGKDIALYEPIFQQTTNTITDCINLCNNDLTCDGITYNNDTQTCMGTKNGQIRNETSSYSAWVKPVTTTNKITNDFNKKINDNL